MPGALRYAIHDLANVFMVIEACAAGGDTVELRAIRQAAEHGRALLGVLRGADAADPRTTCALREVLEPCGLLLARLGAQRGVAVELAVGGDAHVALPGFELQEVVLNLALNAIEAMTAGGRLDVRAVVEPRRVRLEIDDTGPGIPAERLPHLFDERRSTKPGHSGLGLAAVHDIVERAGGAIAASCPTGGGTRFVVTLPIQ